MIGNSGRPRIFAFILDNLLPTLDGFLAVAALKTDSADLADGTLRLVVLQTLL